MGSPTNYYVRPTNGNDSTGDGLSHSTAWKTTQHALDNITRDSTNGDQINVCDKDTEGADVLTAALDVTGTYGTPTLSAPLIVRGYTSTVGDGGIGQLDGNGSYAMLSQTNLQGIKFYDMKIGNSGSANILTTSFGGELVNAEVHDTSGNGANLASGYGYVANCNFHDIGGIGVSVLRGFVYANYFKNGASNKFTYAVDQDGAAADVSVICNTFSLDGGSYAINVDGHGNRIAGNSILSSAGTGRGISVNFNSSALVLINNLVEGFIGAGGVGIYINSGFKIGLYGMNGCYNNTTNFSISGDDLYGLGDNEALGSSPFAKSGSDTFANRFTYFSPNDVGNVRGGAYPSGCLSDKGAVQHADPAATIIQRLRRVM